MNDQAESVFDNDVETEGEGGASAVEEDIIRDRAQVEGKSLVLLARTYNELGFGKPIKKFKDRASAETRVNMSLMSAHDAVCNLGVPAGEANPPILTLRERVCLAITKGIPVDRAGGDADRITEIAQEMEASGAVIAERLPAETFPEGSVASELHKKAAKSKGKPTPRVKKERAPGEPKATRVKLSSESRVTATGAGTSALHPTSARFEALKFIQDGPEHTRTIKELEVQFGPQGRGHLQKLLLKEHVTVTRVEAAAAASEVKEDEGAAAPGPGPVEGDEGAAPPAPAPETNKEAEQAA